MLTRIELVVLDVGGTSIRDTADVAAVFVSALEQHGISPAPGQLQSWRGASKREVIERLLAESGADLEPSAVYQRFQGMLLDEFRTRGVQAIPGVEATIDRLHDMGIRVVLTTGFDSRVMKLLLERLGWRGRVDGVVTADDAPRGRPAPDLIFAAMRAVEVASPRAVVAVGDTVNDLRAGEAAGVAASIGVLTGAHDRDQLAQVAHTAILASAADLPEWLVDREWWRGAI